MSSAEAGAWGAVLVTGGSSFLGSHLVDAFAALQQVDQVIVTGRNPNKPRRSVPGARLEICDIRDSKETKALLAQVKPKIIVHTISPGPFATKDRQLEVNYYATKTLLDAARDDPHVQAFIYTSSIEACPLGHISSPLTEEEAPVNDLNTNDYWYCRTKGAADTLVRTANRPKPDDAKDWSGFLLTTCIRTSGLYGPRDTTIVPAMLRLVNTPGARIQYGPNLAIHEWLYIENAVSAYLLAARKLMGDHQGVSGEAFFITDGKPMKFADFTRAIWKEAGDANMNSPEPKFTVIPFWVLLPLLAVWEYIYRAATLGKKWPYVSRQNFVYIRKGLWLSIDKARERLGYEPQVDTKEGIRRTVQWFRENGAKKED